ncbi:MAG: pyrroline-5-carboxylate reductase [Arcobacter sp.]|nr:MAG: pyrroline-5-carboxylate reductase [Arcobacter sp.]
MKLLLIGAGNMGGAMLQGLQKYDITVVARNINQSKQLKEKYPSINILYDIPALDGYLVIVAVKPIVFNTLVFTGKAKGIISILAGVTLKSIKDRMQAVSYIRAMPNMAAIVQESATSVCGDIELKDTAIEVLNTIGECFWLNSEEELDIATGLAGSAPAWLALVAEGLSDGAVNLGLKRDISYKYIAKLFQGVGKVLKEEHPSILKDKVTSPKGTTIAGIKKLEEGQVRNSFMNAMQASYDRAKAVK